MSRARTKPKPKVDGRGRSPGSLAVLRRHAFKKGQSGNLAGPKVDQPRAAARLLFETFRAKREKLEFDQAAGKLLPVDEVDDLWAKMIAEVRTMVLAISTKTRSEWPDLDPKIVDTIDRLSREALESFAQAKLISGGE